VVAVYETVSLIASMDENSAELAQYQRLATVHVQRLLAFGQSRHREAPGQPVTVQHVEYGRKMSLTAVQQHQIGPAVLVLQPALDHL
ncbi:uncharacterized protein METZ01_LOCUS124997, partial [marine metagenome]